MQARVGVVERFERVCRLERWRKWRDMKSWKSLALLSVRWKVIFLSLRAPWRRVTVQLEVEVWWRGTGFKCCELGAGWHGECWGEADRTCSVWKSGFPRMPGGVDHSLLVSSEVWVTGQSCWMENSGWCGAEGRGWWSVDEIPVWQAMLKWSWLWMKEFRRWQIGLWTGQSPTVENKVVTHGKVRVFFFLWSKLVLLV